MIIHHVFEGYKSMQMFMFTLLISVQTNMTAKYRFTTNNNM